LRSLAAGSEIPISDLSHRATVFEATLDLSDIGQAKDVPVLHRAKK
jgi:hypothetical protein